MIKKLHYQIENLEEKTIKEEILFKSDFTHLLRAEILLPQGKPSYREYLKHPGAAMVVPILKNGNLILIQQYRYPLKKVFFEFPAGKCDPQESSEAAAKRELLEETGYESKELSFMTKIHPAIGYSNEYIDLFLAKDLTFVGRKIEEDENINVIEMSLSLLLDEIKKGNITDVKTQIGAFWAQMLY